MAASVSAAPPARRGSKLPGIGIGVKATQLLKRLRNDKGVSNLEALEVIPKLLKRKVLREPKEVTAAIQALTRRKLYREAVQFALDACAWGEDVPGKRVEGNAFVCGAAFHASGFVKKGWPLTLQLLQRAADASVELDASAEDSALLALVRADAPVDVVMSRPHGGLKALSAAAAHVGRSHGWQMSLALLAKADSESWDQTAWEVLLAACADAQQGQPALAMLGAMRRQAVPTSTAAVLAAVACAGGQRYDLAQELLRDGLGAHETALTRLVMSGPNVTGDGRWQWAMCALDTMDDLSMEVPLSTCNAVISVCAQSRHWQRSVSVLQSMIFADWDGAGCVRPPGRPRPDQISFNGALSACERAARPEVAARLLQQMLTTAVQPELTSYTSLSAAYGRSTGWQLSLALFSNVQRQHLQPDEALLVATGMSCGNQGLEKEAELRCLAQPWQRAELLLQSAQRWNLRSAASQSSLTSCLDKGVQWARAIRSLEAAKLQNLVAETKSYGAALAACQKARAPWQASLNLLEDMSSGRVEISSIALQAGAEALSERNPLQLHHALCRLRGRLDADEDRGVLATASYTLLYHGMLDAHLAAVLERQVLRPCAQRLRRVADSSTFSGPVADTVLSAQGFLGSAAQQLFETVATRSQLALASPNVALRGRLHARRLHHELGAPSLERSLLAAKSIPAYVTASFRPGTFGRLVGHRREESDSTALPSVLADHDRSQHAERQALLSLVEGLEIAGGQNPSGAVHLYISAHPCISCTAVFFHLSHLWPDVRLRLAFDAWEDTRRWTVDAEQ